MLCGVGEQGADSVGGNAIGVGDVGGRHAEIGGLHQRIDRHARVAAECGLAGDVVRIALHQRAGTPIYRHGRSSRPRGRQHITAQRDQGDCSPWGSGDGRGEGVPERVGQAHLPGIYAPVRLVRDVLAHAGEEHRSHTTRRDTLPGCTEGVEKPVPDVV